MCESCEEDLEADRLVNQNVLDAHLANSTSRCSIKNCIAISTLSLLYFVTLVSYDCAGALQTDLMRDLSLSLFQFSQLMSSYSWSSVFSFLGGYLVDRWWGLNRGLAAFTGVFVIGNVIYTLAIFFNTFWLMIIGRLCAGLGGETLGALISCYTLDWFSSRDLNLAFALSNSFSLLTPAVVYKIAHPLYTLVCGSGPATAIICGSSSVLAIVCTFIITEIHRESGNENKNKSDWKQMDSPCNFKNFPLRYWTLTGHVALVYTTMYNFLSLSQDYLVNWKGLTVAEADNLICGYSIIMFLTSPLIGVLADRSGSNITLLTVASVGGLSSHALLAYSKLYPAIPLAILAVSLTVFMSSYSPLIGESVEKKLMATAYSLTYSLVNGCFGLGFLLVGFICDNYGYKAAPYYYLCLLIGALGLLQVFYFLRIKETNLYFNRIKTEDKTALLEESI